MTTTAKIGAFFLVVLVALGVLILKSRTSTSEGRARTPPTRTSRTSGWTTSPPCASPACVGKVDGITLRPDGTAVVHLALDPGSSCARRVAVVRSLGLLGDKYVELQPGLPPGAALAQGALRARPRAFDDITKMAQESGDLKEVSSALAASMGASRARRG